MKALALAAALAVAAPPSPEKLEALSWEARRALAARQYARAEELALRTWELCKQALQTRALDAEKRLPIALGAALEVRAQVMAANGQRAEAVAFLREQLALYANTSIRTRLQKNINLLSLEGQPAPPLEGMDWQRFRGRPVLLFFWAHWCPDCKNMAPALEKLRAEYPALAMAAPTQLYGYTTRGQEAGPEAERQYIEEVRKRFYPALSAAPAPVSAENFRVYGASTVPTLVLVDARGAVRMYHPGAMEYAELSRRVKAL